MTGAVLLMGHGSPDAAANVELGRLRDMVAAELLVQVGLGVLEFRNARMPGLEDAFAELRSAAIVAAQPLLLFQGRHGQCDMPNLTSRMAERMGFQVRLGTPFGDDPVLVELMTARLRALNGGCDDVLLFVGRGSSEAKARSQAESLALQIASRTGMPHEVCYAGISRPDLVEGLELALRHKRARVLVLPYLLHTGVLQRRVSEVLCPIAAARGCDLVVMPHIGNAPEVVRMVARRARALLPQSAQAIPR
ncbi:MAG: sirohydrochlorin chelatase [Candidatus Dormibacteria bacterium]